MNDNNETIRHKYGITSNAYKDVRRIVLRNLNENFFTRCLEGAFELFFCFFFFLPDCWDTDMMASV